MGFHESAVLATPPHIAELDRLGDEIAELCAHLEAATARLLTLIREFDARGGWNRGFPSCAAWLGWRVGLHHRDRGCRFPGCGVRIAEGHHLHHWSQGGPTTLSNLALLCRRHHRAVHEEGYQVAREPDGTLQFQRPDGRALPEAPKSPEIPGDPVASTSMRSRPAPAGSESAWT